MKFNTDKIGSSAKKLGTKDSFKTILWLMAIFAVLFFGKKLYSLIQGIFNWGKTESAENQAVLLAGKDEFARLEKGFNWSTTGVSMTVINSEVAQAIQYMSGYTTNWTELNKMIVKMHPNHFVGFFIKFGVRINDEFANQAGDFVQWLNYEKQNSPIAWVTDPTSAIKIYLTKYVIPFVNKYDGMGARLKALK